MDYYDHSGAEPLAKPVALVALPGVPAESVGKMMAGLRGLPWISMDRAIEHRAGKGLDAVVIQDGDAHRLELEAETLRTVATHPVPHLIVLSSLTLTDRACRDALAGVHIIWLQQGMGDVLRSLQSDLDQKRHAHWSLLYGNVHAATLEPALLELEGPMHTHSHQTFFVGAHGPLAVARALLASLETTLES